MTGVDKNNRFTIRSCFNNESNFKRNSVSQIHSETKFYDVDTGHSRSPAHKNHHIIYSKYITEHKLQTWIYKIRIKTSSSI